MRGEIMTDQPEAISNIWRLYRSNLFLDAYQAARRVSRRAGIPEGAVLPEVRLPDAMPPGAGAGELLLASRLAVRLGGLKLSRFLFRTAAKRFPDDPGVKVASRWMARRRRPVLDLLRESLSRECLDSGDPELDAHWLTDGAFFWAGVRDFARAHRLLDRAAGHDPGEGTPKRDVLRFGGPDPWLTSVRAHVLFCQDRWDEAIRAVRAAWAASPNRPSTAGVLARVLMRANRMDEAAELLSAAAAGQSYETLLLLAYVRCAQAERSPREVRLRIAARTADQCGRLEELTPLRDRFSTQQIALCRLDLAMQAEDGEAAAEQAALLPMPIYRQVSRRLRGLASKESGGGASRRVLLPHPAVFQKQDRCLPTSVAAIAGSFGAALDADELAKAVTYRGTSIWRALTWLRANGYAAKAFLLTQPLCVALLERGIPFVYTFNTSLDDSHATAAVGFDEAAGVLLYHDPAAERFGHVLLDQIGESEHPLGPFGLAFVPAGREDPLEAIPEPDARLGEMQGEWEKTIDLLLSSLRIEPGSDFAYARAWENSANLPRAAQEDVLRRLEERLLLAPGPLHAARTLALGMASRLGSPVAEAAVRRWMVQRPGDPELIEAHADVLLEHGRGRTDAAQAAAELEEALRHHPQHFDLRMSLAHAYSKTLQEDKRREILTDSLKNWPLNSGVRGALAAMQDQQGDRDAAIRLLKEGIAMNPQDPGNPLRLAGLHRARGKLPAAVATLEDALKLLPESVALRRELVQCLCQSNDAPRASEVIDEGLKLYPQSPVFWHMRAEAMVSGSDAYDARQAETALRKALELNGTYYDAADQLAWLLAGQYRFDEAAGVIRSILPMLPNAAAALGRLAWITWVRGEKRPAVDEMAGVLESHPDYRWGWMMLMSWLEELDAPDLTCRLLEEVPPAVRADPEITARRIELLAKARLSEDKLSAAVAEALEDFPRNEDLWERRFDMLADGGRWDAAEEVLARLLAFCGQSPFALARKVRLAAFRGQHAAAFKQMARWTGTWRRVAISRGLA